MEVALKLDSMTSSAEVHNAALFVMTPPYLSCDLYSFSGSNGLPFTNVTDMKVIEVCCIVFYLLFLLSIFLIDYCVFSTVRLYLLFCVL